jgi:hypothetical protein
VSIRRELLLLLVAIMVFALFFSPTVHAGPYRDYNTFMDAFMSLANAYPELVTYENIGKTVENRDIIMFKIGNPDGGKVLFDGAMHGWETLGSEVLYFYAKWLLTSNDPVANRILTRDYTLLIPALNIDEYNNARKNANGVDLNRNFATNWEHAGSTNPDSEYYRGPAPLSEPESQTLVNVFETFKPSFYVNLHFPGGTYYAGSYYGNRTYYRLLVDKIDSLSKELGATPYYYHGEFGGAGLAISDAAYAGMTSFLIELNDEITPFSEIETIVLPRFIPIAIVLSQECESEHAPEALFEDGFESGDFSAWSGLTLTSGDDAIVAQKSSYYDKYVAKFQTYSIASGTKRACVYKNIHESPVVYARGYFYIAEGLPFVDADDRFTLLQFLGSGENIICNLQVRRVHGEDRFAILAFTGDMQTTTAVYPTSDTWYCLELFAQIHATEIAITAYIDGVERLSLTGIDTTMLGKICTVRFGLANSINVQHKVVVYGDNAVFSTSYNGISHPCDLNKDRVVDMSDVAIAIDAYGSTPGDPLWNPIADITGPEGLVPDGKVDMSDLNFIISHFREEY